MHVNKLVANWIWWQITVLRLLLQQWKWNWQRQAASRLTSFIYFFLFYFLSLRSLAEYSPRLSMACEGWKFSPTPTRKITTFSGKPATPHVIKSPSAAVILSLVTCVLPRAQFRMTTLRLRLPAIACIVDSGATRPGEKKPTRHQNIMRFIIDVDSVESPPVAAVISRRLRVSSHCRPGLSTRRRAMAHESTLIYRRPRLLMLTWSWTKTPSSRTISDPFSLNRRTDCGRLTVVIFRRRFSMNNLLVQPSISFALIPTFKSGPFIGVAFYWSGGVSDYIRRWIHFYFILKRQCRTALRGK